MNAVNCTIVCIAKKLRVGAMRCAYCTLRLTWPGLKADILVTHEAPIDHPHGFQAIDDLTESLGATTIIHGHHHEPFSYNDNSAFNIGIHCLMELVSSFFS